MHPLRVLCIFVLGAAASAQTVPSAQQIVARWRALIHAPAGGGARWAAAVTNSNQDGIPGKVEEWLTTWGAYRRVDQREFDDDEAVVLETAAQRRDWNGFIRDIEGQELSRTRNAIFEESALVFGPPKSMETAQVSSAEHGQQYVLRVTPPGGTEVQWYIEAKSGLPLKAVRPGEEDSEITTTFSDWRELGAIRTPGRAHVSETNKPDFTWERVSLNFNGSKPSFEMPKPGPPDARLDANAPPIPFNFENSHIMFKVSVNGREAIWFLFDTGADQEVINETRMSDFGLRTYARSSATGGGNTAEYGFAKGTTFRLPGVELRDQHVAVLDQTGLERALGMPLGGLLGYDFISRFVVEIDYTKQFITLHDPKTWTYTGDGFLVPITFDSGIPFTHGTISVDGKRDIPAFFVIDFGAMETMTLTSPFVKSNDLLKLAQSNAVVNRPAGLENQFFAQNNVRGRIDQLVLGKMTVQSIPVNMSVNTTGAYASPNFSGTIGETLYRRYHVYLDYARKRVIFESTAEAVKPFPDRQTYGLNLLASGPDLHTYTVAAVRPASPAESDGFKKGDVISGFDNKPATEFTLGELRGWLLQPGERHQVQVTRGGEKLNLPVEVRLVSLDKK